MHGKAGAGTEDAETHPYAERTSSWENPNPVQPEKPPALEEAADVLFGDYRAQIEGSGARPCRLSGLLPTQPGAACRRGCQKEAPKGLQTSSRRKVHGRLGYS